VQFFTIRGVTRYMSLQSGDIESLRDRLDIVLGGCVQPAEDTRMADYDWSSVARRYVNLYHTGPCPTE